MLRDTSPRLLFRWTPSIRAANFSAVVQRLERKADNLHGCLLRVATLAFWPYVMAMVPVNTTARYEISGTLQPLIQAVAQAFNFTPQFSGLSDIGDEEDDEHWTEAESSNVLHALQVCMFLKGLER